MAVLLRRCALLLVAIALGSACEPTFCDMRAPSYESMLTAVSFDSVAPQPIPLVLIVAERPTEDTLLSFHRMGCPAMALGVSMGTYRLLDGNGVPLDATTSMTRPLNEWCDASESNVDQAIRLRPFAFTCANGSCTAALQVEMMPPAAPATTQEIEVRLHSAASTCSGVAPVEPRFRVHVERFGA